MRGSECGGGRRVGGGQVQSRRRRLAGGQRHDEPVSGSRSAGAHSGALTRSGPGAPTAAPRPGAATEPGPGTDPAASAPGARPGTHAAAPGARPAADTAAAGASRALAVTDPAGTGAGAQPGTGTAPHLRDARADRGNQGEGAGGRVPPRSHRVSSRSHSPRSHRGLTAAVHRPLRPAPPRPAARYAVTSDRSPPHSVWNAPSRSVLRYVCAPKKSRCPCVSAAGSRSARSAS